MAAGTAARAEAGAAASRPARAATVRVGAASRYVRKRRRPGRGDSGAADPLPEEAGAPGVEGVCGVPAVAARLGASVGATGVLMGGVLRAGDGSGRAGRGAAPAPVPDRERG
ncbi:hypothetical protein GCM10010505_19060 [Kitasatospora aburaviensis]